jgi:DivIVA domain-containing protein
LDAGRRMLFAPSPGKPNSPNQPAEGTDELNRIEVCGHRLALYPGQMPQTLDDSQFPNLASIPTTTFRLGLKGYNVKEVDEFLEALVVEATRLNAALEEARQENASLRAQLSA